MDVQINLEGLTPIPLPPALEPLQFMMGKWYSQVGAKSLFQNCFFEPYLRQPKVFVTRRTCSRVNMKSCWIFHQLRCWLC